MASPIVISILANANQANASLNRTITTTQRVGNGFRRMGKPAVAALGLLVVAGKKAADAAAEDARSQTVLATALRKSAGASDAQVAAMERYIDKTARATGVADDQLRPALGALVRATGSAAKAQEGLGYALDVSAATGKDVTAVSTALAKGYAGNTSALGRLVPGLDKAILKTGDMDKITAELARTTGGTAAKAAATEAGQRARANIAMDEAVETIGGRLLPVYAKAATAGAAAANWLAKNESTAYALAAAIAAVAAIVLVVNVAMKVATAVTALYNGVLAISTAAHKAATAASLGTRLGLLALAVQTTAISLATKAYTAAQWLLNVALTANPIGLVIVALVALVAGLVLAWKNSETFRAIVTKVFNAIKNGVVAAVTTVVNFVKSNWKLLLVLITGPIGAAALLVAKHWGSISSGARNMYSAVKTALGNVVSFVKGIPGKVKDGLGNVGSMLYNEGKAIIGGLMKGILDKAEELYSKVKGIGGKIKDLKGPLSYDKVMLKPEGNAIIQGLIDGVTNQETSLYAKVAGISKRLAATRFGMRDVTGLGLRDTATTALQNARQIIKHYTITVVVEPGMSEEEIGRKMHRAIEAAEKAGLV